MQGHLLIRADATGQIGTGHLMRCLALAQAWRDRGGNVTFCIHCQNTALRQRILGEGFKLGDVDRPHPDPADLKQLLRRIDMLSDSGKAWVVVDGYHFDPLYQKSIRQSGYRVLVIDDYNHLPHYDADILLNQNIGFEMTRYVCDSRTIELIGPQYALLRAEFLTGKNKYSKRREDHQRMLLSLGGADHNNITLKVVKALLKTQLKDIEVNIVVGPANPNIDILELEIQKALNARIPLAQSIKIHRRANMAEIMAQTDVAISAGGSTCWELCFFGIPFIVIIAAENQRNIAEELDRAGAAACIGWHDDIEVKSLSSIVEKFLGSRHKLKSMSLESRKIVDGRGCERIIELMDWLETAEDKADFSLRKGRAEDALQLWKMANNREVRNNSFNPEPIPYDQHVKWLNEKLASNASMIYVLDVSGVLIAQIRYDKKDGVAEIDYAVIPSFRGKGIGRKILQMTWKRAYRELGAVKIRGIVKADNKASIVSFRKAGFEKIKHDNYLGHACFVFEKN